MKKNRLGNLVSDTHRICTKCGVEFERTSKNMSICHKCNTERVKSSSLEAKMYRRAKRRASERGNEFNIEPEDIKIPDACPILGIPLFEHVGKSGGTKNSPSLDRIDSTEGYVLGNIQVISTLANLMKSDASVDELRTFAKWVISTYGLEGEYKKPELVRRDIKPKDNRFKYPREEVLACTLEEAQEKFGIGKKYYLILKNEQDKIMQSLKDTDIRYHLKSKSFVDVGTLSGAACAGGVCEVTF